MEKQPKRQSKFDFEDENAQTLPLGDVLDKLEDEFDHEDDEEEL